MSLPLPCSANRLMQVAMFSHGLPEYWGYAAFRKLFSRCWSNLNGRVGYAACAVPGTASDIARRLTSRMKPASSRATATVAMFGFLPRAASLRYRRHNRSCVSQAPINGDLRDAFVAALNVGTHACRMPVAPCRLDEQLSGVTVAGLRDAAPAAFLAR